MSRAQTATQRASDQERVAARFGKRLERLGWRRDDAWTPYCKRLAPQAG